LETLNKKEKWVRIILTSAPHEQRPPYQTRLRGTNAAPYQFDFFIYPYTQDERFRFDGKNGAPFSFIRADDSVGALFGHAVLWSVRRPGDQRYGMAREPEKVNVRGDKEVCGLKLLFI